VNENDAYHSRNLNMLIHDRQFGFLTLTSMELINGPIETRVLDLSPKSWASTCVVWPLALICQIRRHDEGQRKEIYYMAWERQSEHSAHFQPSLRLQT
jgi:hypothetical protein